MQLQSKASNSKTVSVVIPHFNREDVIRRAIDSAANQTYQEIEIIVVDDGSKDPQQIIDIVDQYDKRVKLIRHEQNRNGAAARNTGTQAANGKWIAFLDSDDEWLPQKIEYQVKLLEQHNEEDVMVYAQSDVRTDHNQQPFTKIWPAKAIKEDERVADYLFCNRGYIPTPSIILSRDLALRVLFSEELRRHQDYDLIFRLEQTGVRMRLVEQPLVIVHWEDMHSSGRGLNPSSSLEFLKNYRHCFSEKAASSFVFGQVVAPLLRSGRRIEALSHLRKHVSLSSLSIIQFTKLTSNVVFRDDRLLKMLSRARGWLY